MSTAPCDWEVVVAQGECSKQWFGAALAHGSKRVPNPARPGTTVLQGRRIHTPWMPTELAAKTELEALLGMEDVI